MLLPALACRTSQSVNSLDEVLKSVRMPEAYRLWCKNLIAQQQGDCLISIHTNPIQNHMEVWIRKIENRAVVCDSYANSSGNVRQKRFYEVAEKNAITLFGRLYNQAATGLKGTDEEWLASIDHEHCVYLLAIGSKFGLTVSEENSPEAIVKDAFRYSSEESKLHKEIVQLSFDPFAFSSIASYVVFMVQCYDLLCFIYQEAETQ